MRNFRQKINEEVVSNPNNPKEPLLFVTQTLLRTSNDPSNKQTVPGVYIADRKKGITEKPIFDANELAIIEQNCPEAIKNGKGGKFLMLQIRKPEFEDGSAQAIIDKLAKGITATGDFGTVSSSDIMGEIGNTIGGIADASTISQIHQSATEQLSNWLDHFDDPELFKALSSIGVKTPFKGLCHELSMRNIMLIQGQNKMRVSAGLPAATYILSPTDWFAVYKRRVNPGAKPIFYWAPASCGYTLADIQKGLNTVLGTGHPMNNQDYQSFNNLDNSQFFDIHRNIEIKAKQSANPSPAYYNIFPYYDISDTYLVDANTDPWSDSERIGVTNNIEPSGHATPAALAALTKQYDKDEEALKLIQDTTGLVDDNQRAIIAYNAIKMILDKKVLSQFSPIQGEDGKANIEAVKQSVFDGVNQLAIQEFKRLYANESNITEKAAIVACAYVGLNHISSQLAIQTLSKYKQQPSYYGTINGKKVQLQTSGTDETGKPLFVYKPSAFGKAIPYDGEVKATGMMDEVKRKCYEVLNVLDVISGKINRQIEAMEKIQAAKADQSPAAALAESYMYNGTYEEGGNSKALASFDQSMEQLYANLKKWCAEGNGEESQESMNESNDWFADDEYTGSMLDMDKENQDLNDFIRQEPIEFDKSQEEERQLAESKFYDIINRINKLY